MEDLAYIMLRSFFIITNLMIIHGNMSNVVSLLYRSGPKNAFQGCLYTQSFPQQIKTQITKTYRQNPLNIQIQVTKSYQQYQKYLLMEKYAIAAASAFALLWIKTYFNGGICYARRDLSNQVAIVTGGNTGIGKQTALELAKQNCTVVIASRDNKKSEQAVQYIVLNSNNKKVQSIQLDLASKKSIEIFVDKIKQKYNRIDILINNAGVMAIPQRELTQDGFEFTIGINHFGHFYLTHLLWDLLIQSKQLRIINLSSSAHLRDIANLKSPVVMDFQDIHFKNGYTGTRAYSRSKLANVLFSNELAARLQNVNPDARVVSLHPGVVRTELMRYNFTGYKKLLFPIINSLMYLFSKDANQGAQTTIYTVFESKDKLVNGGYYKDCKISNVNPQTLKNEPQKRLWEISQKLLNIKFNIN